MFFSLSKKMENASCFKPFVSHTQVFPKKYQNKEVGLFTCVYPPVGCVSLHHLQETLISVCMTKTEIGPFSPE